MLPIDAPRPQKIVPDFKHKPPLTPGVCCFVYMCNTLFKILAHVMKEKAFKFVKVCGHLDQSCHLDHLDHLVQ